MLPVTYLITFNYKNTEQKLRNFSSLSLSTPSHSAHSQIIPRRPTKKQPHFCVLLENHSTLVQFCSVRTTPLCSRTPPPFKDRWPSTSLGHRLLLALPLFQFPCRFGCFRFDDLAAAAAAEMVEIYKYWQSLRGLIFLLHIL